MTNKEIYKILYTLGMVEKEDQNTYCSIDDVNNKLTPSEEFQDVICKDITSLTQFTDELFLNNDINYIKQFLICLLFKNGESKNERN